MVIVVYACRLSATADAARPPASVRPLVVEEGRPRCGLRAGVPGEVRHRESNLAAVRIATKVVEHLLRDLPCSPPVRGRGQREVVAGRDRVGRLSLIIPLVTCQESLGFDRS